MILFSTCYPIAPSPISGYRHWSMKSSCSNVFTRKIKMPFELTGLPRGEVEML